MFTGFTEFDNQYEKFLYVISVHSNTKIGVFSLNLPYIYFVSFSFLFLHFPILLTNEKMFEYLAPYDMMMTFRLFYAENRKDQIRIIIYRTFRMEFIEWMKGKTFSFCAHFCLVENSQQQKPMMRGQVTIVLMLLTYTLLIGNGNMNIFLFISFQKTVNAWILFLNKIKFW